MRGYTLFQGGYYFLHGAKQRNTGAKIKFWSGKFKLF